MFDNQLVLFYNLTVKILGTYCWLCLVNNEAQLYINKLQLKL